MISLCFVVVQSFLTNTAWANDLEMLRADLRQHIGDAYAQARTQTVALTDVEFEALLEPWESMVPDSIEQILARAIRLRRKEPAEAQRFDAWLKHALENPDRSSRSGRPHYFLLRSGVTELQESHYPLAFEAVLRNEMPNLARGSLTAYPSRESESLDSYLAILQADVPEVMPVDISFEAIRAVLAMLRRTDPLIEAHTGIDVDIPDANRIIEPVVAWYKSRRQHIDSYTGSMGYWSYLPAVVLLQEIGTPEALDALNEILHWERHINMPAQGLAPWVNKSLPALKRELDDAVRRLKREISQRQRKGKSAESAMQELNGLNLQLRAIQHRNNAYSGWRHLQRTRDKLAAELASEQSVQDNIEEKSDPQ